jgi:hypothetical protein
VSEVPTSVGVPNVVFEVLTLCQRSYLSDRGPSLVTEALTSCYFVSDILTFCQRSLSCFKGPYGVSCPVVKCLKVYTCVTTTSKLILCIGYSYSSVHTCTLYKYVAVRIANCFHLMLCSPKITVPRLLNFCHFVTAFIYRVLIIYICSVGAVFYLEVITVVYQTVYRINMSLTITVVCHIII